MTQLHDFFENQADNHPDNIALICHGTILTYKDIEERANQLAHWLKMPGLKKVNLLGYC